MQSGLIVLKHVGPSDRGDYQCVAENSEGIASKVVSLTLSGTQRAETSSDSLVNLEPISFALYLFTVFPYL